MHSPTYGSDQTPTPNTTFVEADPSNFRSVVQKLTGASQDPSAQKLPLTLPSRLTAQQAHHHSIPTTTETIMGLQKPNFKLHERRSKKLQLNLSESSYPTMMILNNNNNNNNNVTMMLMNNNIRNCIVMTSPISPLEFYLARGNNSKLQLEDEDEDEDDDEEKLMIAEKGFYLHPSPRDSQQQPPQLLPLFPLHSPSSQSHS